MTMIATEREIRAALLDSERRVLERIASGAPLQEILETLARLIEEQAVGMRCAVLLADCYQRRLRFAAAPTISDDFKTEMEAFLHIGPESGPCGMAAFLRKPVYTRDSETDPLWQDRRDIAIRNGMRAIWSTPILSDDNAVLGTFAMYYGKPRLPSPEHIQLIDMATQMARLAIEARRSEELLRTVFECAPSGVEISDLAGNIVRVNPMFARMVGYTEEDLRAMTIADVTHAEDYPTYETLIDELLAGKRDRFVIDKRYRRKDGKIIWAHNTVALLRGAADEPGHIISLMEDITERRRAEEKTQQMAAEIQLAFQEIQTLKDQLYKENLALKEEVNHVSMFEEIVGSSGALNRVLMHVAKVAPTDSTVLINGETGTGKELIARAIHKRSHRSTRAFVCVNCAAIPPSLIASELFGHEKGAFTGATQRRIGRFELADGGTIFLDEVGELPLDTQIALLRVLQEREIERVGGSEPLSVDVRVLAATNRDLQAAVAAGTFRSDLFYRLHVFPIQIPSLRERVEDIPVLLKYFIDRYASKLGKKIKNIEKWTVDLFQTYHWPGNVRELQNVVERAVILCDGETFSIDETWLQRAPPAQSERSLPLAASLVDREREMIESALAESRGRVSGATGAAVKLGIPRSTLESRIRSLHIDKYRFKSG